MSRPPRVLAGTTAGWVVAMLAAGCGAASTGPASPATTAASVPATTTASVPAVSTASDAATTAVSEAAAPAGRWTSIPAAPVPALTNLVTTGAWDGAELLVVGRGDRGPDDATKVGFGAAYDPVTSTWRRLPVPSGVREGLEGTPQAIWTGRDLVVWGSDFNEAYTPATNSWRHLPAPQGVAPQGGGFATAWTGRYVVFYGGGCCGDLGDGGAVLDPSNGTWRRLPESPLGRRLTSAVWTGTEVVFAGGETRRPEEDETVRRALATGAAWNPTTNRWRSLPPMPNAGAVDLVWDGRRVLALGASTSAAYTPATDTWTALPVGYDGRSGAGLAWTGTQLLVWGGLVGAGQSATPPPHGLAYDPVRARWSALPASPLHGRTDPVTAWTGSQFVVWGGDGTTTGASWTP